MKNIVCKVQYRFRRILYKYHEFKRRIVPRLLKWKFDREFTKWAKWQFNYVPNREHYDSGIGKFTSLVILPEKYMHDSGYACMDFVAIQDRKPICRLSGCSDVLHIGGIMPSFSVAWSIDCLPCGLLHLFVLGRGSCLEATPALSSFEILFSDDMETGRTEPRIRLGKTSISITEDHK